MVFFGTMLLGDLSFAQSLHLEPADLLTGQEWWTPLSAMFVAPESYLFAVGLTLWVQWFLGSALEGFWSARRYLFLTLSAALAGYVGTALLGLTVEAVRAAPAMTGPAPLDLATVVAFGLVFRTEERDMFGLRTVKGSILALISGVLVLTPVLLGLRGPEDWPALLPAAISALVAALFVTQPWRPKPGSVEKKRKKRVEASHLRVVRTPEDMLN